MKHGLILMSALLPTVGHLHLIDFARGFLEAQSELFNHLTVMISSRSFEPIDGKTRLDWLRDLFPYRNISFILSEIDDAPQNPTEMKDGFWDWWVATIKNETFAWRNKYGEFEYLFASEDYGVPLSEALGTKFVPYDIPRDITNISSTDVRTLPTTHWSSIIEPARIDLAQKQGMFCLFGQESVGKTTIARSLSRNHRLGFLPEWARPYLETVGRELTVEKMHAIFAGQLAQQRATIGDHPITIMDTDLLSTIGYMKMLKLEVPEKWYEYYHFNKPTHYFVLPDDVPFEPDPLRYGGNVRETDRQYWIDLLNDFGAPYTLVPEGTLDDKMHFIVRKIVDFRINFWEPIRRFKRT